MLTSLSSSMLSRDLWLLPMITLNNLLHYVVGAFTRPMPVLKANSTLLGNQLYLCSSPFCHSLCLWFWIFLWIFFAFTFVSTAFASSASSTKSARTNTAVVPPALALVFGLVLALALCCRCDQLPLVVDLDLKMKFLAVTSKQTLESRHDAPCHSSSWSP